jgi:hypothetical protein
MYTLLQPRVRGELAVRSDDALGHGVTLIASYLNYLIKLPRHRRWQVF